MKSFIVFIISAVLLSNSFAESNVNTIMKKLDQKILNLKDDISEEKDVISNIRSENQSERVELIIHALVLGAIITFLNIYTTNGDSPYSKDFLTNAHAFKARFGVAPTAEEIKKIIGKPESELYLDEILKELPQKDLDKIDRYIQDMKYKYNLNTPFREYNIKDLRAISCGKLSQVLFGQPIIYTVISGGAIMFISYWINSYFFGPNTESILKKKDKDIEANEKLVQRLQLSKAKYLKKLKEEKNIFKKVMNSISLNSNDIYKNGDVIDISRAIIQLKKLQIEKFKELKDSIKQSIKLIKN